MADKLNNFFLVNAPAGSGKTTTIKKMLQDIMLKKPDDNVLCITYTNRAAEELLKETSSNHVFIGTIHSFLCNFMTPFFSHSQIVNLYFEMYGSQIKERIRNADAKENITASNERYIEKFGVLDYETVKQNVSSLYYNQSEFMSYYYGGLSHDELVKFSSAVLVRFPIVANKISKQYQHVFIDEYQDTMSEVLQVFYNSLSGTTCDLYLFGDKMQQIYDNYDGSFEAQYKKFDTSKALSVNYRSTSEIIGILNNLYNDEKYVQKCSNIISSDEADFPPRVIICDDISQCIKDIRQKFPDTIVLYLQNKKRFSEIGAEDLYNAVSKMDKYSYGKGMSFVDVLTTPAAENPDPAMKLMFFISDIADNYKNGRYGLIVQSIKENNSIFSASTAQIFSHRDKIALFDKLSKLDDMLHQDSLSIKDVLVKLSDMSIVNGEYADEIIADEDNKMLLLTAAKQVVNVFQYLKDPHISTQHGVKGESHDSVIFVADSSSNLNVQMYRFFEVWSQISFSLNGMENFYYDFKSRVQGLEKALGFKMNSMCNDDYKSHKQAVDKIINTLKTVYNGNDYFQSIYKKDYDSYFSKPGVTKAKGCLNANTANGILNAYKLFYVGCSRARKNLIVLLSNKEIKGDTKILMKKFAEIGFDVE